MENWHARAAPASGNGEWETGEWETGERWATRPWAAGTNVAVPRMSPTDRQSPLHATPFGQQRCGGLVRLQPDACYARRARGQGRLSEHPPAFSAVDSLLRA